MNVEFEAAIVGPFASYSGSDGTASALRCGAASIRGIAENSIESAGMMAIFRFFIGNFFGFFACAGQAREFDPLARDRQDQICGQPRDQVRERPGGALESLAVDSEVCVHWRDSDKACVIAPDEVG